MTTSARPSLLRLVAVSLALGAIACAVPTLAASPAPAERAVPRATCAPGDNPERALQGQVPLSARNSGASRVGNTCNLTRIGQYQGQGAGWVGTSYEHCYYMPTMSRTSDPERAGVQVLDVREPGQPRLTARLQSAAMLDPWESLKVHPGRGLLAAVFGKGGAGPVFFDVYDIKTDCTEPRLLFSGPMQAPIGHEGDFAPDGLTYYASSTYAPTITAIDLRTPTLPRIAALMPLTTAAHGVAFSPDGTRLYASVPKPSDVLPNGLQVLDVTGIQRRTGVSYSTVGMTTWEDGALAQQNVPVTYGGKPYTFNADEGGSGGGALNTQGPAGGVRLLSLADETTPRVVSKIKLEIQLPQHNATARDDTAGNGGFGYQAHYCSVDRVSDPTLLACGMFQSGIRVFDVSRPTAPREVAYYNPRAQVGRVAELPGSEHATSADLRTDWCTSAPRFVERGGEMQLWTHCQDNGFLALRLSTFATAQTLATPPSRPAAPAPGGPGAAPASAGDQLPATGARPVTVSLAVLLMLTGLAARGHRTRC